MFGSIFGELFEVNLEVYLEDNVVGRQTMQAPKEMLMINFIQNADQMGKDSRPMKLRMYRPDTIWDRFENQEKPFIHEVEFLNNAMIAWQEDKKYKEERGGQEN